MNMFHILQIALSTYPQIMCAPLNGQPPPRSILYTKIRFWGNFYRNSAIFSSLITRATRTHYIIVADH